MSKDKIIEIPLKYTQIRKNKRGNMSVDCIVTDRWLRFSNNSAMLECGEVYTVDVMTTNSDDINKKICQVIIRKEELVDVIGRIKCTDL